MNIIPLVLSFLLILSLSAFSLFEQQNNLHFIATSYQQAMQARRGALNDIERKLYRRAKSTQKKISSKKQKSHRPSSIPLSLFNLFEEGKEQKELYNLFAKLLRETYHLQKKEEYFIVDALLSAYHKQLEKDPVAPVFLEKIDLGPLHSLYYRILKGPPALLDLITIEDLPFSIPFASKPFLQALLGDKIAKILSERESITKEAFLSLLAEEHLSLPPSILQRLDFSKVRPQRGYLTGKAKEGQSREIRKVYLYEEEEYR